MGVVVAFCFRDWRWWGCRSVHLSLGTEKRREERKSESMRLYLTGRKVSSFHLWLWGVEVIVEPGDPLIHHVHILQ